MKSPTLAPALTVAVALTFWAASPAAAHAHGHGHGDASELSALSALPVAVSVAAPVLLLSAGVQLTVVTVEASATGTVWVLERAHDGARMSVRFAGKVVQSALLVTGTVVVVTAESTGHLLSAAGQVIAFVPNAIGRALLHHEEIAR